MSHAKQYRLERLIGQFADLLEQIDLSVQERAQFAALLAALRIEAGICREALQ